jgi:hypothetical protein
MQRISTPTRFIDKFGPGKDGFTDGNPATGLSTTQLEAIWFDSEQEEIANVIEFAGIPLNPADHTQLWQAINAIATGAVGGYVLKSGDTMTGQLTAPVLAAVNNTFSPEIWVGASVDYRYLLFRDIGTGMGYLSGSNGPGTFFSYLGFTPGVSDVTAYGSLSVQGNFYGVGSVQAAYIASSGNVDAAASVNASHVASTGNVVASGSLQSMSGRVEAQGGQPCVFLHVPSVIGLGMWTDAGGSLNLGLVDGAGIPQAGWARLGNDQGFYAGGGLHPGIAYGANNATFFADNSGGYIRFREVYPHYHQLGFVMQDYANNVGLFTFSTPYQPDGGGALSIDSYGNVAAAGAINAQGDIAARGVLHVQSSVIYLSDVASGAGYGQLSMGPSGQTADIVGYPGQMNFAVVGGAAPGMSLTQTGLFINGELHSSNYPFALKERLAEVETRLQALDGKTASHQEPTTLPVMPPMFPAKPTT